jgi:hypothetical protein
MYPNTHCRVAIALFAASVLGGCFYGAWSRRADRSTSIVEFLYPGDPNPLAPTSLRGQPVRAGVIGLVLAAKLLMEIGAGVAPLALLSEAGVPLPGVHLSGLVLAFIFLSATHPARVALRELHL